MFERYTEAARRVIFFARYMASQTGSERIESEHMLLGLLKTDQALARRFLGSPWAAEEVWKKVEQFRPLLEAISIDRDLPLSDENKRVLGHAAEEAEQLGHKHIGPEHVLLGLLREEKSFAAEILRQHGLSLKGVRKELELTPHKDWPQEKFIRERGPLPPDIAALHSQIDTIRARSEEAAKDSLAKLHPYLDEERAVRGKLRALYRKHRMTDWMWE